MKRLTLTRGWPLALIAAAGLVSSVQAATPAELLAGYVTQAGAAASPERGQQFFTADRRNALKLTCASCHGATPTGNGRHDLTEKRIAPLAPAFNKERFTDAKKSDGWFKTNCQDVVGRDCTAQEKADVLSWLISLK